MEDQRYWHLHQAIRNIAGRIRAEYRIPNFREEHRDEMIRRTLAVDDLRDKKAVCIDKHLVHYDLQDRIWIKPLHECIDGIQRDYTVTVANPGRLQPELLVAGNPARLERILGYGWPDEDGRSELLALVDLRKGTACLAEDHKYIADGARLAYQPAEKLRTQKQQLF